MYEEVAAKVCYFHQELDPNQRGELRWVMPGTQDDRCSCTSILPGGVGTIALNIPYEPYYTDRPLFTDDEEIIHDYFDCHDNQLLTKKPKGIVIFSVCVYI